MLIIFSIIINNWLSLQVQAQTLRLSGPNPEMAALPSLPPLLTQTRTERTPSPRLRKPLRPVICNTAAVGAVASQKATSLAASVWPATRGRRVRRRSWDTPTWRWSSASSASLLRWRPSLCFCLKGTDHKEVSFFWPEGSTEWRAEKHPAGLLRIPPEEWTLYRLQMKRWSQLL